MDFDKAGGRRFILAVGTLLVATLLQWFTKLDASGTQYGLIVVGCIGGFITGDVFEKKNNVSAGLTPKGTQHAT